MTRHTAATVLLVALYAWLALMVAAAAYMMVDSLIFAATMLTDNTR